ncbi:MAG: carboxypeptidase regulatory-like domain-containing protein, partial [bacterium]|nr:carboxypeptidase regulatory-like domain-containing protein [bacterium]
MYKKDLNRFNTISRIGAILLSVLCGILFYLTLTEDTLSATASGLLMKVEGKVIVKESKKGIGDVEIAMLEVSSGESFFTRTDKDGKFEIKMVPAGIYSIAEVVVNMTCPSEYYLHEMQETIMVSPGRNITGLTVYLKEGAEISGYVYGPDGTTPVKDVTISIDPWRYGKQETVKTDHRGKYVFKGRTGGPKYLYASAQGMALESKPLDLTPGEKYENVNFVLGKGNISVKGKVVSPINNQAIEDSLVFFTYTKEDRYYSAGWAKTDQNGYYSLIGLKHPGSFELAPVHEKYEKEDSTVTLNKGENTIDVVFDSTTLASLHRFYKPRNAMWEPRQTFVFQTSAGGSNINNCKKCKKFSDVEREQNEACNDMDQKPECIEHDLIAKCIKKRCAKRNFYIICRQKCEDKDGKQDNITCGKTKTLGAPAQSPAHMILCINNCDIDSLNDTILHELYHICDYEGR